MSGRYQGLGPERTLGPEQETPGVGSEGAVAMRVEE